MDATIAEFEQPDRLGEIRSSPLIQILAGPGREPVPVHKLAISSLSWPLDRLLNNGCMSESITGVVDLSYLDLAVLRSIISFAHHGTYQNLPVYTCKAGVNTDSLLPQIDWTSNYIWSLPHDEVGGLTTNMRSSRTKKIVDTREPEMMKKYRDSMLLHAQVYVWAEMYDIRGLLEESRHKMIWMLLYGPATAEMAPFLCELIDIVWPSTYHDASFRDFLVKYLKLDSQGFMACKRVEDMLAEHSTLAEALARPLDLWMDLL